MEKFWCFCAWNTLNIQFTAKLKYSVTCTHTHHTYTHTYYTYTHIPHLYPPTPTHTIHTAPSSGGCLHQSRPRRSSRHPTGFRSSPAHAQSHQDLTHSPYKPLCTLSNSLGLCTCILAHLIPPVWQSKMFHFVHINFCFYFEAHCITWIFSFTIFL